jgi:hypothetical protein
VFAVGIAAGVNTGVGIRELSARTPTSRGAGCETHKSGSVGTGGEQSPLVTRQKEADDAAPMVQALPQ